MAAGWARQARPAWAAHPAPSGGRRRRILRAARARPSRSGGPSLGCHGVAAVRRLSGAKRAGALARRGKTHQARQHGAV
eukprot:6105456-Prymnesium_polylepis.1